jgi:hypothetical protein
MGYDEIAYTYLSRHSSSAVRDSWLGVLIAALPSGNPLCSTSDVEREFRWRND